MPRRSKMEIYIDILKAVADGRRKPTHVMHHANLPWTRMKKCLDFLLDQSLLVEEEYEGSQIFSLTLRGKEVLAYHKKIEVHLSERKIALPSEIYVHRT